MTTVPTMGPSWQSRRNVTVQPALAAAADPSFAHDGILSLPDDGTHPEVTERLKGAFHSSDLWYVFKSLKHCWRPWTQGDWDLSEKMLTAWTNFAKNSNPAIGWEPCTAEKPLFMLFKLDAQDAEASEMGAPILPGK